MASITPFLFTLYKGFQFPRKLVYSLPLRVLTNSLYEELSKKVQKISSLIGHELKITIQTGENNQDPYFLDGDIVFTTIDQSISSLLSIPLSLPINQGNINIGAILTSYLVFDEFHLLEVKRSLSTIYNILERINKITPFCLMTATLSDKLIDSYCSGLEAKKVVVDISEVYNIDSQHNKIRNIKVERAPINIDNIIRNHKQKSIVICNTVESCQEAYLQIKSRINNLSEFKETELICIHSQLYSQDRKNKERLIKQCFGRGSDKNAILVSTQVVEVGIDITCETMHTEISPINSFLQRIGRCARYEGEKGLIFVYDVNKYKLDGEKKKNPYLPYDEDFCSVTFKVLEKIGGEENLDYEKSQDLVNEVLTLKEAMDFNAIIEDKHNRFNEILNCWQSPNRSYASRLIRQIDSINILLCRDTESLTIPYFYDFIPINRYSLISRLKMIEKETPDDWLICVIEDTVSDDEEIFGKYSYPNVEADDKRLEFESIIILNPKYVFYDEGIGLNFRKIGKKQSRQIEKENKEKEYSHFKETYEEHIENMIKAYNSLFKDEFKYMLGKLKMQQSFCFDFDELIKFILILHDYGKLNKAWQISIKKYQSLKGYVGENEILAHSDYDPKIDFDVKAKLPNHAGIGAAVAASIVEGIFDDCESLCISVLNSIVKHHSITSNSMQSFSIANGGKEAVLELLKKHCPSIYQKIDFDNAYLSKGSSQRFDDYSIDYYRMDTNYEAVLYFIFSRILRLCDQRSFDYKQEVNVY